MSVKTFIKGTLLDLKAVWEDYPNIIIWSIVAGIILYIL